GPGLAPCHAPGLHLGARPGLCSPRLCRWRLHPRPGRRPRVKIESIEIRQTRMQLTSPFTTSFGTTLERPAIIVAVHSEGVTGLAECVAFEGPWYSYETLGTAWHVMTEYLIPDLLGTDLAAPEAAWDLFAPVRGHNMAK